MGIGSVDDVEVEGRRLSAKAVEAGKEGNKLAGGKALAVEPDTEP